MIELAAVRMILEGALAAVEDLDGVDLDETDAVTNQTKTRARTEKARRSQELLHLSDQLALASQLTRNQYWRARGFNDARD